MDSALTAHRRTLTAIRIAFWCDWHQVTPGGVCGFEIYAPRERRTGHAFIVVPFVNWIDRRIRHGRYKRISFQSAAVLRHLFDTLNMAQLFLRGSCRLSHRVLQHLDPFIWSGILRRTPQGDGCTQCTIDPYPRRASPRGTNANSFKYGIPDQTDGICTLFQTRMAKPIPYFRLEMLENDTLWGGTYLHGLYMGVPPPPPPPPPPHRTPGALTFTSASIRHLELWNRAHSKARLTLTLTSLLDVKNNSQEVSKPVARHFNQPGHSRTNMTIFDLSLHRSNTESRKCTEQRLTFIIGTLSPRESTSGFLSRSFFTLW